MASKTKKRTGVERVVESAADAAEELGQAAVAFKESWEHMRRARSKAAPATRAASRAVKRVTGAATRAVTKVRRATKSKKHR